MHVILLKTKCAGAEADNLVVSHIHHKSFEAPSVRLNPSWSIMPPSPLSSLHDWTFSPSPPRISAPVYASITAPVISADAALSNSNSTPSLSDRVINHFLKYGVNCRKQQITIFIGHSRTSTALCLHTATASLKCIPERLREHGVAIVDSESQVPCSHPVTVTCSQCPENVLTQPFLHTFL